MNKNLPYVGLAAGFACFASLAPAKILITEVLPSVATSTTNGDTVELHNTGPAAVNLTNWILTDLDGDSVESDVGNEATFAPASLGLPSLAAGEFAVVVFVDNAAGASYVDTNYGLLIVAPLASVATSFLNNDNDQLLLANSTETPIDFVAWSTTSAASSADDREDLQALTSPTIGYAGIAAQGDAAWDASDSIADTTAYRAATVDFTGFSSASTYGPGALRRASVSGVFAEGSPDGTAQWEVVARSVVRLGNASDDVSTVDGIQPIRITDDFVTWMDNITVSTYPDWRITSAQGTNLFTSPSGGDFAAWDTMLAHAMANEWDAAFDDATAQGYEVVEFLDTATGRTFHLLRERKTPNDAGYRGQGVFVFYDGAGVRPYLVLGAPHPFYDSLTEDELALAIPQVLPRVAMFAGTHRRNSTTDSSCDGQFSAGVPYTISDVPHHTANFFHETSKYLNSTMSNFLEIQFHGYGSAATTDDLILSNGVNASPAATDFTRLWAARIEAQNFLADGTDLTTAAIYPEDTNDLGATNNVQGRLCNSVAAGNECGTYAGAATGRFIHIEQDLDVRQEPQHIISALIQALGDFEALPVELDSFRVD